MNGTTTQAEEFPFVESLPQIVAEEVQSGVAAFRKVVREYEAAQARHGVLVPISTVAEALDVSHQRVSDLLDDNRLEAAEICGRRWVIASSVAAYLAEGPRKAGRPRKLSKIGNTVRWARELSQTAENQMTTK